MTKQIPLLTTVITIFIFYITWGSAQLLDFYFKNSNLPELFFSTIYTGIAGCLIPLHILKKFNINIFEKTNSLKTSVKIIGYIFLIITILYATVGSEALFKALQIHKSILVILKYLLLFFPMALAISLFAFAIIPYTTNVDTYTTKKKVSVIFFISLFFIAGFLVDTLFKDLELSLIMGSIGLLLSIAFILLRNFWLLFSAFYIILLINTLADNKYSEYPFGIVIISSALSLGILLFYQRTNKIS